MLLNDILQKADNVVQIVGAANPDIKGVAYDSRHVKQGYIFVAIKGFKADGHLFIPEAIKNGAAAIIAERTVKTGNIPLIIVNNSRKTLAEVSGAFYNYPWNRFKLVGVTGTNGKTTTTFLIKQILEKAGYKVGLIGTVANMIGDQELSAERTTPESTDLYKLFARMADENVSHVVMEVSSHSLELYRVHGIDFTTAVFTNLTQDHLDFHDSMEDYYNAKFKLFKQSKKAVVNVDDAYGKRISENLEIPYITYSITNTSDIRARNISYHLTGVEFEIEKRGGITHVQLAIPGRFSVYNALAATAACLTLNVPLETIKAALAQSRGVPGRFEVVDEGQDFSVVVDYAHTPDGLENILKSAREVTQNRLIVVFGCGGDRDRKKRPVMGRIGVQLSDYCIITSDNPRSENPDAIIHEIVKGAEEVGGNFVCITDRRQAIQHAIQSAEPGDMIVIAGKGHETYQIIGDDILPFDDRKVAREILRRITH